MTFEDVLLELQSSEHADSLKADWEQSQQEMPGDIPFLKPEFVRRACPRVYVPGQLTEAAARMAERIAGREALKHLAWHMSYRLYRAKSAGWDDVRSWPPLEAALGDDAGLFYLVVLVSNVPEMEKLHREHNLPPEVVRDTLLDVRNWVTVGRPGARPGAVPLNIAWLQNHLRGDIYRLGRLQFQFATFWGKLRAFRSLSTGAVVALSEDGVRYTEDGRIPAGGTGASWTATLTVTDTAAVGYPIHPAGKAVNREVHLRLSEWQQQLAPGDKAVNVHIPGGARLEHPACGDSFRKAIEFFPHHFPEYQFAAFCCGSWILNAWLEEVLPPDANLVRFQRELYLFPTSQWPPTMLDRVFGEAPVDPATAPRDTALRRAIIAALEQGHDLRGGGGGMFLFPQDFRWGEEVYRRQPWPW